MIKIAISSIDTISSRLNALARVISALAIVSMLCIVIVQIVTRYVFDSPPTWTEEIGKLLMIWGGLLGASVAFKKRKDMILYYPSDNKGPISLLRRVIRFSGVLVFTGVILYHSPSFLKRSLNVDFFGIQGIPVIWATLAIPCFTALIFIHNLDHLFKRDAGKQDI